MRSGIKYKRPADTSNEEASKKVQLNLARSKISLNGTLRYLMSHPQGCRGSTTTLKCKERKEGEGRWTEGRFRK